jgi:hypothetical protein
MTQRDDTETPKPQAPEPVSCSVCRRQLPAEEALQHEGEDYMLWFCGLECYNSWKREQDSGSDS